MLEFRDMNKPGEPNEEKCKEFNKEICVDVQCVEGKPHVIVCCQEEKHEGPKDWGKDESNGNGHGECKECKECSCVDISFDCKCRTLKICFGAFKEEKH